jgi:hypothetical protein
MAISPNTNFSVGQVLTSTQANQWPRGIMAFGTRTSNTGALAVETVTITAISFTAVANRYYKITYFEPQSIGAGTLTFADMAIKQGTTTAGTLLNLATLSPSATVRQGNSCECITTFSSGTVNIVATVGPNGGGTINCTAGATFPAFLIVEDLGPA